LRNKLLLPALVVGAFGIASTALWAAEPYKVTRCPPDLPYCIQEVKPAYTQEELAQRNAIRLNPTEEARKIKVRADAGYRDPKANDLCAPPHFRMTARDGCQPSGR
jgi:hypothetical protein